MKCRYTQTTDSHIFQCKECGLRVLSMKIPKRCIKDFKLTSAVKNRYEFSYKRYTRPDFMFQKYNIKHRIEFR